MFCINVRNTRCRFVDRILDGSKPEETRTAEAFRRMERYLSVGDRIGIVERSRLVGYVTYMGHVVYDSADAFRQAFSRHLVPAGSSYDYDGRGKVGLVLSDPVRVAPVELPKMDHIAGFRFV